MKSHLKRLKWQRIFIQAPLAYAVFVGILFVGQRSLLYYPHGTYQPPLEIGLNEAQEIRLPTADNHQALAWFAPPPEDASGKIIIYFHGNGEKLNYLAPLLTRFRNTGFGYIAVEYPGYPGSDGEPTEQGIYHNARAILDFAGQKGFKADDIILLGRSLGTGVAVQMASEYKVGLLALVSPFTTIADAAADIYWYVPVNYLVLDRFDSLSKIAHVTAPVYIFHGTEDTLVPYALGEQLFERTTAEKKFFAMENQDHNHIDMDYVIKQLSVFARNTRP